MKTRLPWFEREFRFDLSHEKCPELIERLRGTPLRIAERCESIPGAYHQTRIADNWSIQENVGHLIDLEPLWYGRIDDIFGGLDVMRPADLENRKTHDAHHNEAAIDYIVEQFRLERQKLVHRLDEMKLNDFAKESRHPRLDQPMRIVDLCLFVADHDDCHVGRITQLYKEHVAATSK